MKNGNPFSTSTKVHSCLRLEAESKCTYENVYNQDS